jgi:hypothetical protein
MLGLFVDEGFFINVQIPQNIILIFEFLEHLKLIIFESFKPGVYFVHLRLLCVVGVLLAQYFGCVLILNCVRTACCVFLENISS